MIPGEIAGFIISSANHYATIFVSKPDRDQTSSNATADTSPSLRSFSSFFRESDLKKQIYARE